MDQSARRERRAAAVINPIRFFTADELRSAPRVGSGAADAVNFGQYDVGLSLSGPLRHDRLWFFAAYNPTFATQDVVLAAIPKQRETQTHHLFAGKVTWRATWSQVFSKRTPSPRAWHVMSRTDGPVLLFGGGTREIFTNDTFLYSSRANEYEEVCCGERGDHDPRFAASVSAGSAVTAIGRAIPHGGSISHR